MSDTGCSLVLFNCFPGLHNLLKVLNMVYIAAHNNVWITFRLKGWSLFAVFC